MKVKTWITDTKTYSYDKTLYYDISDKTILLTSIPIDLTTFNLSFKMINKYDNIISNLHNYYFADNNRANFASYDYNKGSQWLGFISSYSSYSKYAYQYSYYTIYDLIDENLNITNVVNYNNADYIFPQRYDYFKIDKSNSDHYVFNKIHSNHDLINPLKYNNLIFYFNGSEVHKFDLVSNSDTRLCRHDRGYYTQYFYVDDSLIIFNYETYIVCMSYNDVTTIYSINVLSDDQLQSYNNKLSYFNYVLKSRTDTDLELELVLTLPETNPDDNVEYQVPHIFTVLIKDYKTSDQSMTLTESTIDFGNFNKYFQKKADYVYTHIINAFNNKYLVYVYHEELLTFIWDESNSQYKMIDYKKVASNMIMPVWNNQLELVEYNKYDPNGTHVTFLTFNGTSWEINRSVYAKSNIILNNDEMYYIGYDDELIIDKCRTNPSASIKFDETKYVYVDNKVIHTGITVNSFYYLPETTIRYKVQILSDNAKFAANNSNTFYIEMQNGEYHLNVDITGYNNVELNLGIEGAWILTDGIQRDFTIDTAITYNHEHSSQIGS